MGNAAFEVAGRLAAALERGAVQAETAAALHQLCGRAGLVVRYHPLAQLLFDAFWAALWAAQHARCARFPTIRPRCQVARLHASIRQSKRLRLLCLPLRVRVSGSTSRTVSRADIGPCVHAAAQQRAPDASTAAASGLADSTFRFSHTISMFDLDITVSYLSPAAWPCRWTPSSYWSAATCWSAGRSVPAPCRCAGQRLAAPHLPPNPPCSTWTREPLAPCCSRA